METTDKMYTVIISKEATEMLISHSRFLAQVSEQAASNLIAEFSEKTKSFEQFPERNPWLSDRGLPLNKYRKLLIYERYLFNLSNSRQYSLRGL